jgi:hypothetical protein
MFNLGVILCNIQAPPEHARSLILSQSLAASITATDGDSAIANCFTMHFGKSYAQLLQTLPPDLRENAIEYGQLKKLIKQVVSELSSHGLSPDILHQLLQSSSAESSGPGASNAKGKGRAEDSDLPTVREVAQFVRDADSRGSVKVLYEVDADHDKIEPRLRIISYEGESKAAATDALNADDGQSFTGGPSSPGEDLEIIRSESFTS